MLTTDYISLLDEVLTIIKKTDDLSDKEYSTCFKNKGLPIPSSNDLDKVRQKLVRDGFIIVTSDYEIAIEGYIFIEELGYRGQISRKKNEDKNQTRLERLTQENALRLNNLTCFLAIGSGLLALIEILKFGYFLYDRCHLV